MPKNHTKSPGPKQERVVGSLGAPNGTIREPSWVKNKWKD